MGFKDIIPPILAKLFSLDRRLKIMKMKISLLCLALLFFGLTGAQAHGHWRGGGGWRGGYRRNWYGGRGWYGGGYRGYWRGGIWISFPPVYYPYPYPAYGYPGYYGGYGYGGYGY